MGLFSKKAKPEPLFAEREIEFNRKKLNDEIVALSGTLYDYRHDESHKLYTGYLQRMLNLEVLAFSEGKVTSEADMAYRKGRIAGIRDVLNAREVFIANRDAHREKKEKGSQEAKRSYVRSPSTQAGLSI
jgi:hypothetical protein